mmetsp:Transcript_14337/g.26910  ORF Transcript_14337/g.26910 Transcript_14337/m.26910 type:complete len:259 (+) Transcript_14337:139-915(+)
MSTLQATLSTSMKLSASSTPAVMNNTNSSSNPHVIVVHNPTTVGTGSVLQCNSSILNLCNSNDNNKEQGTTLNKKKQQDKKKREDQRKHGMSFEEDDMMLDDDGELTSIKDIPIIKLSLETLKAFARKLRLKINSAISKGELVKELSNYKRLGRERNAIKEAVISTSSVGSSANCLPSGLCHSDGTIFRVILTILDPSNRECYMGTAQQISRGELGAKERYVPNYARLACAYNDEFNDDYSDAGVSLSPHQDLHLLWN